MGSNTKRFSALDDPPCPECGHAVFTERVSNAPAGTWSCLTCGTTFEADKTA